MDQIEKLKSLLMALETLMTDGKRAVMFNAWDATWNSATLQDWCCKWLDGALDGTYLFPNLLESKMSINSADVKPSRTSWKCLLCSKTRSNMCQFPQEKCAEMADLCKKGDVLTKVLKATYAGLKEGKWCWLSFEGLMLAFMHLLGNPHGFPKDRNRRLCPSLWLILL